jgi:acetyl esterase/lipase
MTFLGAVGIALAVLIGIVILYLAIVIFAPVLRIPEQRLPVREKKARGAMNGEPTSREEVRFDVDGLRVSAWLYLPDDLSGPVPCIVMSHGFGGTKDMALEPYALRFRQAGLAALCYDYRCFGESDGEPRQLYSISKQLEDCLAAVEYVRGHPNIDPERIALWGTSAGGGYGLVLAAADKRIACVSAQCSAFDSDEDGRVALEREGYGFFLRLFVHAQRDKGRSRFGLSPHRIPIVGEPGTTAMVTAPGALEGYAELAGPGFVNQVCARVLLMAHGSSNPIDHAKDVECPVLLQVCEEDNLVSMGSALRTAEILGEHVELKRYPIGHFDIYSGEDFQTAIKDQLEFFTMHLSTAKTS